MSLPNNPVMLLSYINTMLRDEYPSLTELCSSMGVDEEEIRTKLAAVDYSYDADLNRFV